MTGQSKALRPGDGRAVNVLGNTFTFKVMAADTGDSYSVIEIISLPNGGLAKPAERFGSGLPASGPDPATLEALAALARQYGVEPSIG
jgi:hypothetical protein